MDGEGIHVEQGDTFLIPAGAKHATLPEDEVDIQAAVAHWAPRFTTQGVDPNDFRRVTQSITR